MWLFWLIGIAVGVVGLRLWAKGGTNKYHPDLTGKNVLVLGGTAGIGKETVKELVELGANVLFTGRDEKGVTKYVTSNLSETVKKSNPLVRFIKCDMDKLENIKKLAEEVGKIFTTLDMLVNNAGTTLTEYKKSEQGLEKTMAVNYLAPFYLTHLLYPLLKKVKEARVINVASMGYMFGMKLISKTEAGVKLPEDWFLEQLDSKQYQQFMAYGKSKLGNVMFTKELSKLNAKKGINNIKTASLHPGAVRTDIWRTLPTYLRALKYVLYPIFYIAWKSEIEGAQTTLAVCLMPFSLLRSGAYYLDCQPKELSEVAQSEQRDELLWRLSCKKLQEFAGEPIFPDLN